MLDDGLGYAAVHANHHGGDFHVASLKQKLHGPYVHGPSWLLRSSMEPSMKNGNMTSSRFHT